MRLSLIREAARIMAEEGVADYGFAKRKAAERLGAPDTRNLPSNREVQEALIEYQQIFGDAEREAGLRTLRRRAVEAMEFFARFRPRLVGSVLSGTAGADSDIQLHLFSDTPEAVAFFLMEHGIPYESGERRLRFGRGDWVTHPAFRFVAGGAAVELIVFDELGLREAPRSEVHGRPMERASVEAVRELIA